MNIPTAAFIGAALLAGLVLLTGAAIVDLRDAARLGSFCPNGVACTHEFEHDAPAILDDLIDCAEVAMSRQMNDFERAMLVAAGVPGHAVR